LPQEFVDELSLLQDQATQVPWDQVEPLVRGLDVVEFDRTPLAAASVAQVHAARLRSGEAVVVKVRRSGVDAVVERDLDIVARLARTLQRSTRWGRSIGTVELARGFADALREELDFRVEARNMTAIAGAATARGADDGIVIPVPQMALCTQQVLVMQRLDGTPLNSARVTDPQQLARDAARRAAAPGGHRRGLPRRPASGQRAAARRRTAGPAGLRLRRAHRRRAAQRPAAAAERARPRDPTAVTDSFLELVERPDELDEQRLERALGQFMVRHLSPGLAPDVRMFTDLFAIVSDYGPGDSARGGGGVSRAGHPRRRPGPGGSGVRRRRRGSRFRHRAFRRPVPSGRDPAHGRAGAGRVVTDAAAPAPSGRSHRERARARTPRLRVRLLADDADRRVVTGLLHQVLLTALASTRGSWPC